MFAGIVQLRAVLEAVLEGRVGHASVAGDAARLSVGCYEMVGGDPASPAARGLVATATRPRELLYGNDPAWRRLILEVFGGEVADRPMREYDPGGLDAGSLERVD